MESIGIAGSPRMETWIVDLLFGQPGQATTDTAATAPTAPPAVSVASVARSAVAAGTGHAISALQAGGTGAAPDTGTTDPKYMTVAQANALVTSNNAMTSEQISKAFYSGKGLQDPGLGVTETFSTIVQMERDAAQTYLNWANDPASAPPVRPDPDSLRAMAAQTNAYADSMQKAFDNHTLVIQKMSDIQSLNYTEREVFGGPGPDSQPESGTWSGGYDKEAMNQFISQFKDGKHLGGPFIGGVQLLMTLTDDSLT